MSTKNISRKIQPQKGYVHFIGNPDYRIMIAVAFLLLSVTSFLKLREYRGILSVS